jgi:hypothetical protein
MFFYVVALRASLCDIDIRASGLTLVQIPLWNSALAKSPISEYPPNWPMQWMQQADGQKSPVIPFPQNLNAVAALNS